MKIGDTFKIEYGAYGNYTTATVVNLKDTEYDHIKIVEFTIPRYTGDEIHTTKAVNGVVL
jgi:copper(I)-binding protein